MAEATRHERTPAQFSITRVEDIGWWTMHYHHYSKVLFPFRLWGEPYKRYDERSDHAPCGEYLGEGETPVEFIRRLYDKKIGEVGSYWNTKERIEYRHAKVKLGDVFDYYTTNDGLLKTPAWSCLQFAVDEYLEEEAIRSKFHPARVREFIDENGLDRLERMG